MKYLSVCSGIEAASVAWEPLGWTPKAFAEIEPFPAAVLSHRFPAIPNHGDMTKYKEWNIEPGTIDILVGGTPCQSFSVAGLRKGLNDPRGNLMLTYGAIADYLRPRWIVWENVPGVLSSNGGRDFGTFLGMLGELGYGFAYRVLDAQYFGVAQRRRRVFVVGYLGDWRPPAAVLFESESLCRNPAPSRKKGEGLAGTISARTSGGGGLGTDFELAGGLQVAHTLRGEGFDASEDGTGRGTPIVPIRVFDMRGRGDGNTVPTLCTDHASRPSDFCPVVMSTGQGNADITKGHAPTLNCNHEAPIVCGTMSASGGNGKKHGFGWGQQDWENGYCQPHGSAVRRLTPRECERLQGFPDDWTKIPWRGSPAENCPDGPRYKACGNSMAVPVMRWIGERIQSDQ